MGWAYSIPVSVSVSVSVASMHGSHVCSVSQYIHYAAEHVTCLGGRQEAGHVDDGGELLWKHLRLVDALGAGLRACRQISRRYSCKLVCMRGRAGGKEVQQGRCAMTQHACELLSR